METESAQVIEQQQLPQIEQQELDQNKSENAISPPALLEKRKQIKRAQSCKQTKDQKRPQWSNHFAFLNDTKREKLYQVPELPKKKKTKKVKKVRIKSAPITTTSSEQDKPKVTKDASSSSSSESDDEKPNFQRKTSNSTDSNKTTSTSDSKKSTKSTTNDSSTTLKRPKFKTTVDLDKINYDNAFNYRDDLNYQLEDALNNLHMSTTYKNLMRSMKANVLNKTNFQTNTTMSSRSSLPDLQLVSDLKSRKFIIHEAFYEPTSENDYYKKLRRLIRPSLPFYLFAKHHYYKFYEDNWDYYPNPPGQKFDYTVLLKRRRNNSLSSTCGSEDLQKNTKTSSMNSRSYIGSAKSKN